MCAHKCSCPPPRGEKRSLNRSVALEVVRLLNDDAREGEYWSVETKTDRRWTTEIKRPDGRLVSDVGELVLLTFMRKRAGEIFGKTKWYSSYNEFLIWLLKKSKAVLLAKCTASAQRQVPAASARVVEPPEAVFYYPDTVYEFVKDLFRGATWCSSMEQFSALAVKLATFVRDVGDEMNVPFARYLEAVLTIMLNKLCTRVRTTETIKCRRATAEEEGHATLKICCHCNMPVNINSLHNKVCGSSTFEADDVQYCELCVGCSEFYFVPLLRPDGGVAREWTNELKNQTVTVCAHSPTCPRLLVKYRRRWRKRKKTRGECWEKTNPEKRCHSCDGCFDLTCVSSLPPYE